MATNGDFDQPEIDRVRESSRDDVFSSTSFKEATTSSSSVMNATFDVNNYNFKRRNLSSWVSFDELPEESLQPQTPDGKFLCPICNDALPDRAVFKRHYTSHTGLSYYFCAFCNFKSLFLKDMKRHHMTHTGEKPFACPVCSYRASRKTHIKSHVLTRHPGAIIPVL